MSGDVEGDEGTYRALITAANEAENRELADNIGGMTQPLP